MSEMVAFYAGEAFRLRHIPDLSRGYAAIADTRPFDDAMASRMEAELLQRHAAMIDAALAP